MKLFQRLLVAPAALGLFSPLASNATEVNLNEIANYSDVESIEIVNHFDNKLKTFVELNRGDVLIHNSLVVHGSGPNKSVFPRKGFTIRYSSNDQSVNKEMQAKYEQSLKEQLLERGDTF